MNDPNLFADPGLPDPGDHQETGILHTPATPGLVGKGEAAELLTAVTVHTGSNTGPRMSLKHHKTERSRA